MTDRQKVLLMMTSYDYAALPYLRATNQLNIENGGINMNKNPLEKFQDDVQSILKKFKYMVPSNIDDYIADVRYRISIFDSAKDLGIELGNISVHVSADQSQIYASYWVKDNLIERDVYITQTDGAIMTTGNTTVFVPDYIIENARKNANTDASILKLIEDQYRVEGERGDIIKSDDKYLYISPYQTSYIKIGLGKHGNPFYVSEINIKGLIYRHIYVILFHIIDKFDKAECRFDEAIDKCCDLLAKAYSTEYHELSSDDIEHTLMDDAQIRFKVKDMDDNDVTFFITSFRLDHESEE